LILVISDKNDLQIYYVMIELEKLGASFGLLNVIDFPSLSRMSQTIGTGSDVCWITLEDGKRVRATDVTAVWFRKPSYPKLHPNVAPHEREFAFAEARVGLNGFYAALKHAHWISPIENIQSASNKLEQLRRARILGFDVPQSIFTNDADEARAFVEALGKPVVYKPAGNFALLERAGTWDEGKVIGELYTTLLDAQTLQQSFSRLSTCPGYFQEYVEKEIEIRATVVAENVFSAELHSQSKSVSEVDWRKGNIFELEHRVHALPSNVADQCIALTRAYGLQYSAIDLIKKPDGSYVFLEINPNGQYGWLEALTSLKISKAIACELARSRT
jgi:glutathione synthase/RimK-type ligase-like ATP-grasp enzyme